MKDSLKNNKIRKLQRLKDKTKFLFRMLSIKKLLKKKKRRMLRNKKTGKLKQRLKDKIYLT